jgi:ABC-type glycerol-3-phosphate transport system permease component
MQFFSHWGIALATTMVLLATTVVLYVLFQRRCTRLEAMPRGAGTPALDSTGEVE